MVERPARNRASPQTDENTLVWNVGRCPPVHRRRGVVTGLRPPPTVKGRFVRERYATRSPRTSCDFRPTLYPCLGRFAARFSVMGRFGAWRLN